jgi:thermitase
MHRAACGGSVVAAVAICLAFTAAAEAMYPNRPGQAATHVPGELLVRFDATVSPSERAALRRRHDTPIKESLRLDGLQRVEAPDGAGLSKLVQRLEREPDVLYAEPNRIYRAAALPNDPAVSQQWGLVNSGARINGISATPGADIQAPRAWDIVTGSGAVIVAVVDSGIRFDNQDLDGNVWTDPVTGLHGKDWVDGGEPLDENGHGTHVAGILGAEGNNGRGTTGVAWRVTILPLRVLNRYGEGTADDIADAFTYAAERGVPIVNASLGGSYSSAVADAIGEAKDTLFVVAAGNSSSDVDDYHGDTSYPCEHTHENVLCVTASDMDDRLAGFSNWGKYSVDLAAPGSEILSTHPEFRTVFFDDFESPLGTRWTNGGAGDPWDRTTQVSKSPTHALSESPQGRYSIASGESITQINRIFDLSGLHDCRMQFWARIDDGEAWDDLQIWERTDPTRNWGLTGWIGEGTANWTHYVSSWNHLELRFVWRRVGSKNVGEGADIDDVALRCLPPNPAPDGLEFFSGTSLAAPHAAGVAALVLARRPGASVSQLKNALMDGAERLPSLAGKLVSGGRLDAYGAVTATPRETPRVAVGPIRTVAGGATPFTFQPPLYETPATGISLGTPVGVEALPGGGFMVAETSGQRVMKVSSTGAISWAAGTGEAGFSGDGGHALYAKLNRPHDVAPLAGGGFLIADTWNHRIRRVDPSGRIETVAGNGQEGYSGDGAPARAARLMYPQSVSPTGDGGFLIADSQYGAVRRVSATGVITTVAGPYCGPDEGGDCNVRAVAATADGFLFVQGAHVLRNAAGRTTVVAGTGEYQYSGDRGPATEARLFPSDVAPTPDGGFLIADYGNQRVRLVLRDGRIFTVAGREPSGFGGDGQSAIEARLNTPRGVAVGPGGGFLVADTANGRIRFVESYPSAVGSEGSGGGGPPPPAPPPPSAGEAGADVPSSSGSNDGGPGGGARQGSVVGTPRAFVLVPRRVKAGRSGRLRLQVRCKGRGLCEGTILLTRREPPRTLGRAGYRVPGDTPARFVQVRLTRRARALLSRRGTLRATVNLRASSAAGGTSTLAAGDLTIIRRSR